MEYHFYVKTSNLLICTFAAVYSAQSKRCSSILLLHKIHQKIIFFVKTSYLVTFASFYSASFCFYTKFTKKKPNFFVKTSNLVIFVAVYSAQSTRWCSILRAGSFSVLNWPEIKCMHFLFRRSANHARILMEGSQTG